MKCKRETIIFHRYFVPPISLFCTRYFVIFYPPQGMFESTVSVSKIRHRHRICRCRASQVHSRLRSAKWLMVPYFHKTLQYITLFAPSCCEYGSLSWRSKKWISATSAMSLMMASISRNFGRPSFQLQPVGGSITSSISFFFILSRKKRSRCF